MSTTEKASFIRSEKKMKKIISLEKSIDEDQNLLGSFLIEPLETGQGITLGNALRRTLLSDLTGLGITGVRIHGITHEFMPIPGVREDPLEILMNLKEINFKNSFFGREAIKKQRQIGVLKSHGPRVITAGMFTLPKNSIQIVNPTQYICTIVDTSSIFLEVDIEKGQGYQLIEEREEKKKNTVFYPSKTPTLQIDTLFNPIRGVNFKVRLIHDSYGNLKESLYLQIVTNGSITPQRALQESFGILLNLFGKLFLNSDILSFSSEFSKKMKQKETKKLFKK